MPGEMCWLPVLRPDGEKVLHLRSNPSDPWRPYKACPQYSVSDYNLPKVTRGLATYQKLMGEGWILIPSTQTAQDFIFGYTTQSC